MKSFRLANLATGIAIVAFMLPACRLAAQNADSPAVSKLLEAVKSHAALADEDAHTLASYTRSDIGWQTHGKQLTLIKEHVNDLISDSNQLNAMRDEGSPWQQEAIDRIGTLLPEMASNLTSTIDHLNDNKNRTSLKPYRDLAKANETVIHKAHEIIADFVDYSQAKAKSETLEKQLQLPAASESGS
ncbi:MAG TPA: hypothetical protein VGR47_00915 [Terracidiphilus sp.]|nr:hypothetical protein [Terracidiphilus sp.]